MSLVLLAFLLSLGLALLSVPLFSKLAQRVGLVDHPDNKRKLHKAAIPMVGGLTLVAGVTAVTVFIWWLEYTAGPTFDWFDRWLVSHLPARLQGGSLNATAYDLYQLIGLFCGAFVMLLVGLADDRFKIRGRTKLLGQFVAVTVLVLFGYEFQEVNIAGYRFYFGIFSVFVIYAWVIASVNSVNLLDGADGIASTIGIVMSLAMTVMMISQGKIFDAVVAISIAGTLAGFLRYNFPPARAYLGDAGSMLIGFLLSALAIRCTFKQNSAYAFAAPIALLAIPFIDTVAAIVRRRLTGRSIFAVDRGHLHHALQRKGYSPAVSVLWVALLCSTTAIGGTMALIFEQSEYAVASVGIVGIVMVFFRIFGVGELQLVTRKAKSVAKTVLRVSPANRPEVLQSSVHVQGHRDWQVIWEQFCEFADQTKLNWLSLDVNAPWLHESFHATRKRADVKGESDHEWFTTIPLIVDGRLFGKVELLSAPEDGLTQHQVISKLLVVVAEIEASLSERMSETDADGALDKPANSDSANPPGIGQPI